MCRVFPFFLAIAVGATAFGSESGQRLSRVLVEYTGYASVAWELRHRRIPGNPSDEEARGVLALLENRIGCQALVQRIRASAYSVASLRLKPTQAFLALMDLLLEPGDVARVLARNVTQVRERNVYGFISNPVVRDTFFCLPGGFLKKATAKAVFDALESAIADEGYPLPVKRTEEIAVALVPELAEALEKVRRFRPAPTCPKTVASTSD